MCEGRMEQDINRRVSVSSAAMQTPHQSTVVKEELSQKTRFSVNILTLTCGHELWVMTEKMRLWIQAAEMTFLHEVTGL